MLKNVDRQLKTTGYQMRTMRKRTLLEMKNLWIEREPEERDNRRKFLCNVPHDNGLLSQYDHEERKAYRTEHARCVRPPISTMHVKKHQRMPPCMYFYVSWNNTFVKRPSLHSGDFCPPTWSAKLASPG